VRLGNSTLIPIPARQHSIVRTMPTIIPIPKLSFTCHSPDKPCGRRGSVVSVPPPAGQKGFRKCTPPARALSWWPQHAGTMRGYHGRERTEASALRGGRVAGGYGRTYTLLYGQWIYGAPRA
jgi:hypothetical protein